MDGDVTSPRVGTAWLLLSHAGWLALSIACQAVASTLLTLYVLTPNDYLKANAVAWCSLGLLFTAWTGYAVGTTCAANRRVKRAVFGDGAFAAVFVLISGTVALGVWTLVNVARL
jgi:hypothetical protein